MLYERISRLACYFFAELLGFEIPRTLFITFIENHAIFVVHMSPVGLNESNLATNLLICLKSTIVLQNLAQKELKYFANCF